MIKISNWSQTFETAKSRKLERVDWINTPARCDSFGYIELMSLGESGVAAFGVFQAMCQAMGGMRRSIRKEGAFMGSSGKPMSRAHIATLCHLPAAVFSSALEALKTVGWVEEGEIEQKPPRQSSANRPPKTRQKPAIEEDAQPVENEVVMNTKKAPPANRPPIVRQSSANRPPPATRQGKERKVKEREGKVRKGKENNDDDESRVKFVHVQPELAEMTERKGKESEGTGCSAKAPVSAKETQAISPVTSNGSEWQGQTQSDGIESQFSQFLRAFPNKSKPIEAEAQWVKAIHEGAKAEEILAAIPAYKRAEARRKNQFGEAFVARSPGKALEQRFWEHMDESPQPGRGKFAGWANSAKKPMPSAFPAFVRGNLWKVTETLSDAKIFDLWDNDRYWREKWEESGQDAAP